MLKPGSGRTRHTLLMTGIGLCLANLLGLLIESIIYGLFLLLYLANLIVASGEKAVPVSLQRMFRVSTLMLFLATTHLTVAFVRLAIGFQPKLDGRIDPTVLAELHKPTYKMKITIFFLQTMMADAVMVWRCFVIYDKRWWLLMPGAVAVLLDIATLVVGLVPNIQVPDPSGTLALTPLGYRIAFLSTTMALHLTCSVAIVIKICLTRRSVEHFAISRNISPVIIALVESAAVYTITVFILLLCNLLNSNGQFVIMDLIVPLVGVVFCLITIRVRFCLRATPGPTVDCTSERGLSTYPLSTPAHSGSTIGEMHFDAAQERSVTCCDAHSLSNVEQGVPQVSEK